MRRWLRRLVWVLPIVAALAILPHTAAQASIFDCFSALAPLDVGAEAAEIAAKAGACTSQATSDPVMAMTIAALTASAVGGAFSTSDQCLSLINGSVGRVVAAALLNLPLPGEAKSLLAAFASGNSMISFDEIVAAFPVLSPVIGYIHCGCAVAGAPGEYAKLAQEYSDHVNSCANFASDAVDTFLGGAESVGEAIHHALNGPSLTPGIQMEQTCFVQYLPDGVWTKTAIWTDPGFQCNVLRCPDGHVVIKKTGTDGKMLNKCEASCPEPIQSYQAGGSCYWTIDSKPVDGVCTQTQGVTYCCGTGQKVTAWGVCSPACSPGLQYWDMKTDHCANCASGWYPVYNQENSSVGSCAECPAGQTYDFASRSCEPLNCQSPAYYDPATPHVCAVCAPGQVFSASSGKCECGEGTFAKGTTCVCPKGATRLTTAATFTCSCPEGATLDPTKLACVCPQGQHVQSTTLQGSVYSQCVSDLKLQPPTQTLVPTVPVLPPPPLAPTAPPNRTMTAPRTLPVPPPVLAVPPRVLTPVPVPSLRCAPGYVLNADGTACVPAIAVPPRPYIPPAPAPSPQQSTVPQTPAPETNTPQTVVPPLLPHIMILPRH